MLDQIEQTDRLFLVGKLFESESLAAQYAGGEEVFTYHYNNSEAHYIDMRKMLMAYQQFNDGGMKMSKIERMIARYKELFGDKNDQAK